jgi:hypothetical protein
MYLRPPATATPVSGCVFVATSHLAAAGLGGRLLRPLQPSAAHSEFAAYLGRMQHASLLTLASHALCPWRRVRATRATWRDSAMRPRPGVHQRTARGGDDVATRLLLPGAAAKGLGGPMGEGRGRTL